MPNCDRRWMPNHDRFECQTAIDSDAILQDTAEDYYATYSPLWGQYPEALLFVNWLYNHSSVLHERAEIIKCAEMLMQEDDFEICESILRQQKLLRERIDETLSEEIVQKCRNINGEYVWPWILPFSAAGMKHSSIQHQ